MIVGKLKIMISVYQVKWTIHDGGEYVPGECGGYHRDLYGTDIIPATSEKMAEEIVEMARPSAEKIVVKKLADLEKS